MPKVTLTVSYEEEEFGRGETSCYSREVDDLDIYDWMWYLMKASETAGFDVKDIQLISSSGKIYRTEP
jgi:hypothetical protein